MTDKNKSRTNFKYTISMCNLNNSDTLEESIKSIIKQTDNRFELLVIDDGSTDGSLEILKRLDDEITNLRYVIGNNRNLGEARNHSFREANGEHIIESIDLDDKYHDGILDFIKIYEALCDNIGGNFYLKGNSINAAPKTLLLDYSYRSMGYGEDTDLWRRLFADDKIIWLNHEPFYHQLREEYSLLERIKNLYEKTVVDFRSGVSLRSFIYYCLINSSKNTRRHVYFLLITIPAYISAVRSGRYTPPSTEFRKKGKLQEKINQRSVSLERICEKHDINIQSIGLSTNGRKIFIKNSNNF